MGSFAEFIVAGTRTRIFINVELVRAVEPGRHENSTQIVFDGQHYVSVVGRLEDVIEKIQNA